MVVRIRVRLRHTLHYTNTAKYCIDININPSCVLLAHAIGRKAAIVTTHQPCFHVLRAWMHEFVSHGEELESHQHSLADRIVGLFSLFGATTRAHREGKYG